MEALKRTLLIEDDSKNIKLTLATLAEHNLANGIAILSDGMEALDNSFRRQSYARRPLDNPGLILFDFTITRMDGVQGLGRIKADAQLGQIPVAVPSSSREPLVSQACRRLSAIASAAEPVRFAAFVDAATQSGVFRARMYQPPPAGCRQRATDPNKTPRHTSIKIGGQWV